MSREPNDWPNRLAPGIGPHPAEPNGHLVRVSGPLPLDVMPSKSASRWVVIISMEEGILAVMMIGQKVAEHPGRYFLQIFC